MVMVRFLRTATLATLLLAAKAQADWQMNLTPGVTEVSEDIYGIHMMALWVCIIIGIVVFGAMFYSILHHRKDKGHQAATFHESTKVEIIWTAVPVIILLSLAVPAAQALIKMEDSSNSELTVKITAYQWKWQYEYPNEGIKFFSSLDTKSRKAGVKNSGIDPASVEHYLRQVDSPLVVPAGKKIRVLITSNDVIHSWGVPALGVKKDAIPGFVNDTWFNIKTPGEYRGQCVELCGKDHGYMPITVVALDDAAFQTWVTEQKTAMAAAQNDSNKEWTKEELIEKGSKVYATTCSACHQAGGQGIPGVFPAMTGSKIATGDIKAHLDIVLHGKANTAMQAFGNQLSDADIAAVITFERNGLGNSVGDMLQPADVKAAR
ncbi:cytochrome c oxidase subunit II [Thiolinea disciformis]|uniref:cytochrome c oxidase subunit II n=1 Tax=Thiolinea disciformis TaxID=125614 RepID=UPI00036B0452|nr:cytochrome c oxidase subunit II [Thiolinea disciformis]